MDKKTDRVFDDRGDWLIEWVSRAELDKLLILNCVTYFFAATVFGAPLGKSGVICMVVGAATMLHYGRQTLTRFGIILMIATLIEWAEVLPPTRQILTKFFGPW